MSEWRLLAANVVVGRLAADQPEVGSRRRKDTNSLIVNNCNEQTSERPRLSSCSARTNRNNFISFLSLIYLYLFPQPMRQHRRPRLRSERNKQCLNLLQLPSWRLELEFEVRAPVACGRRLASLTCAPADPLGSTNRRTDCVRLRVQWISSLNPIHWISFLCFCSRLLCPLWAVCLCVAHCSFERAPPPPPKPLIKQVESASQRSSASHST